MLKNEKCTSRNIPLPIQREVRQRCGFGCVICGMPLYEYEHMEEWALVHRHVADEITLLCDQHHREKTSGLLPKEKVLNANKKPHNLREDVSKPYDFHFYGNEMIVHIGSGRYIHNGSDESFISGACPIMIDGMPLVAFKIEDGHVLLYLNIFDRNNNLVLRVIRNQLIYKASPWDIEFVGKKLTLREGHRKILIEIIFNPPNEILISRGILFFHDFKILIDSKGALINDSWSIGNNTHYQNFIGLSLGRRIKDYQSFDEFIDDIDTFLYEY